MFEYRKIGTLKGRILGGSLRCVDGHNGYLSVRWLIDLIVGFGITSALSRSAKCAPAAAAV